MFGFVLLAAIVFVGVSAAMYWKSTDPAESVPARLWVSVKMGALALVGVISTYVSAWIVDLSK